jgi:hypothetical protein
MRIGWGERKNHERNIEMMTKKMWEDEHTG